MAKVDVDLVKMILQRNELDARTVARVIEDLNHELQNQVDEEKPPPVKKEFAIMVSDPNDDMPDQDLTGWVLQYPEGDSPYVVEERLIKAAYDYNQSPKGRRMPVQTIGETCEHVAARFLKEQLVWVKTKEPVYVLKTQNKIPQSTD